MVESKINIISEKIIDFLYKGVGQDEKEVMVYGLKILLSTLMNFLLIFIVASLLGVTKLALIAAITAGVIRKFSGGVHASTFKGCAIVGTIIFSLLGLLAYYLGLRLSRGMIELILWIVFFIGSILIYYYAPAGIKEKPIHSLNDQIKFKIYSFIIFFILILIGLFGHILNFKEQYILAISLGVFWQLLTITPLAYRLFNREYIRR